MRVLIVDDEPLARQRLRDQLGTLSEIEILAEAADGRDACEQAATLKPDLILLDISMPIMDGLEAARHLAELEPAPAVVFCTAHDEHALAAFDAGAVDYLMKPIRLERLREALFKAQRYSRERAVEVSERLPAARVRTHLCARLRGSMRLIPVSDVYYLQADEKYVVVHHARGEDLIEDSLKSLEAEFGDAFLRIHRNCLVAAREITELRRSPDGSTRARLRHVAEPLEVSRRCLPGLRQRVREL